jgi:hypothetical protein
LAILAAVQQIAFSAIFAMPRSRILAISASILSRSAKIFGTALVTTDNLLRGTTQKPDDDDDIDDNRNKSQLFVTVFYW